MNTKLMAKRYSWIVIVVLLLGCTPLSIQPTATSAPTLMPVLSPPTTLPTFTPYPTRLQITLTPSPMPLPLFPLDGYVMVFVKDGDLYFQDGNSSPIKLTGDGKGYSYILSDDNRKVAVSDSNSYAYDNLGFSINTDGTQKKLILPIGWPDKNLLWGTHLGVVEFIPGTHRVIFSTHLCYPYDNPTTCVSSIYLDNLDTGTIKKLADLGFSGGLQHENFIISPNGKMVAVMTTSSVDILDMDGIAVRQNILSYRPNTPTIIW